MVTRPTHRHCRSNLADRRHSGSMVLLGAATRSGIVCPLKPGDQLTRGQRYGMIKFGSTTELILPRPDDVTVHVTKGDTVRGGLTKLATMTPTGSGEARTSTSAPSAV